MSLICGISFLIATLLFEIKPDWVAKTEKPIIEAWLNQHPTSGSALVYWDDKTQFSAQFYSAGKAKFAKNQADLCKLLSNQHDNYLVVNSKFVAEIPSDLFAKFTLVKTLVYKDEKMLLVHCPVLHC